MSLAPTKITPDDFQKPYDAMSYQETSAFRRAGEGTRCVCMYGIGVVYYQDWEVPSPLNTGNRAELSAKSCVLAKAGLTLQD